MKEILICARAGQGAITTASLLGEAAFRRGKYALSFPHFGAARMGAPMNAFVRLDSKPIRLRSQIEHPDYILVIDPTLLIATDVLKKLKEETLILVNKREAFPLPKVEKGRLSSIPADEISQRIIGKPFANTVLLGAFAAATKEIELNVLCEVIEDRFKGEVAEKNKEMAKEGYNYVCTNYR